MTIAQIRTITVPVSDQDVALKFYTDTLGFEVKTDQSFGGNRWLEVAPAGGGSAVVLHPGMPGTAPGSSNGVVLVSDDLDADCRALLDAGVRVDGPEAMPWGRQATFTDPDGNGFVLSSVS
jgi:predicted enzyme related to lactoylglutathione lyase